MNILRLQAAWLFSSTCFAALLQVLQLAVLARKLDSHQLGVLAIVNALLAIATVLQDLGMSSYVVHRQTISVREQSTVYWINVIFSLVIGGALILLAWPVAWFYHLSEMAGLVALTSLNFLVLGHLSQYQAYYVKAQRMIELAKIEIVSKLFAFVCTLAMIYLASLKVSAVILGLFINALSRTLLMMFLGERTWRPSYEFDRGTAVSAMRYGFFQLGSQSISQLRTQADSLIVGKLLGADTVGIYSLAKELILQPLKLILPVINRLSLPLFAQRQHDRTQTQQLFLRATFITTLISSGLYLAIGVCSPIIAWLLYGNTWRDVYPLVPLMLLFGMLRPMSGLTCTISQANGRTNLEFYWNIIASSVMVALFTTVAFYPNIHYVALLLSFTQLVISLLVHPVFIRPVTGISFLAYTRQWAPITLLFIIIMLCVSYYDLHVMPEWFLRR